MFDLYCCLKNGLIMNNQKLGKIVTRFRFLIFFRFGFGFLFLFGSDWLVMRSGYVILIRWFLVGCCFYVVQWFLLVFTFVIFFVRKGDVQRVVGFYGDFSFVWFGIQISKVRAKRGILFDFEGMRWVCVCGVFLIGRVSL